MIGKPSTLRMATRPSASESRLGAVLAEVDKLMKRGHRLVVFMSATQVMRRVKSFTWVNGDIENYSFLFM